VKKPPSRFKQAIRELQLIASAAAAVCILYALITSPILLAIADLLPAPSGRVSALLVSTLLSHGTLLLILPGVCFALRWVVDCDPRRLAFGAALITEGFLVALRFSVTGIEEGTPLFPDLLLELILALLAGALGTMAGRAAGRMVAARMAHSGSPVAAPESELAEKLRQAQSSPAGPAAPAAPADRAMPPKVDGA
jgi:hypothetical protein